MNEKGRVAVFLSGRGSNFVSLYHDSLKTGANFRIEAVVCDRKKAPGLKKAKRFGIPAYLLARREFSSQAEYEKKMIDLLEQHRIDLICLAGYMRIVGERLLRRYPNRIMNIHPALLPAFAGLHAQKQTLDHGAKASGCTVHFADAGTDTGPIILQRAVAVREGDDEETLSRRILKQEHRAYPSAVRLFFSGRLTVVGRRVLISENEK